MTAADYLREVEARTDAATAGPWSTYAAYGSRGVETPSEDMVFVADGGVTYAVQESDAEFIAHARTDVPRLVTALRAVLSEHEKATHIELDYCSRCVDHEGAIWPCMTVRVIEQALGGDAP